MRKRIRKKKYQQNFNLKLYLKQETNQKKRGNRLKKQETDQQTKELKNCSENRIRTKKMRKLFLKHVNGPQKLGNEPKKKGKPINKQKF